jgi:hypothetical protein
MRNSGNRFDHEIVATVPLPSVSTSPTQFADRSLAAALLVAFVGLTCGKNDAQQPVCYAQNDCVVGLECRLGRCVKPLDQEPDAGPPSCAATGTCLLGEKCASGRECKSQFCNSGVCCNEQCGGSCAACNLKGSVGTCKVLPKGTACGAYVCDGTSPQCDAKRCTSSDECSPAYTCCTAETSAESQDCIGRGLTNTCYQLPACSTLQDDFEQPPSAPARWDDFNGSANPLGFRDGGTLHLALGIPKAGGAAFAGVAYRQRVSLEGSSCQVEMPDLSMVASNSSISLVGLALTSPDYKNSVALRVGSGERLVATEELDGGVRYEYSPKLPLASMRFLRISADAGVISFAHSADGNNFVETYSSQAKFRLGDVRLSLTAYEAAPLKPDSGGFVTFDNLNIIPKR